MFEVSAGTPAVQTINTLLSPRTSHSGCGLLSNQEPRARLVDDTERAVCSSDSGRYLVESFNTFFNCKASYLSLLFQMFF